MAETESQVEGHLEDHLARLPEDDQRSRAIILQMQADEVHHGRDRDRRRRRAAAGTGAAGDADDRPDYDPHGVLDLTVVPLCLAAGAGL